MCVRVRGCVCVCVDNEDNTLVMLKWYSPVVLLRINEKRGGRGGVTLKENMEE